MSRIVTATLFALSAVLGFEARAQACANPCLPDAMGIFHPDVHIVYSGATTATRVMNTAMKNLYGDPIKTCRKIATVYQCMRDLDNDGMPETCVQAHVGDSLGACEGVSWLDAKYGAFWVCNPTGPGGTGGIVPANGLHDNLGNALYANFTASEV